MAESEKPQPGQRPEDEAARELEKEIRALKPSGEGVGGVTSQTSGGGGGLAGDSMKETRGTGGGPSTPEPLSKDIGKR